MKVSASRVVAFLTPVFAAGSAALTPWLVKYTGLHISPSEVTTLAVTGATAATGAALKWLHGLSQWERLQTELGHVESAVNKVDPSAVGQVESAVEGAASTGEAKLVQVIEKVPEPEAPAAFPPTPSAAA